MLEIFKPARRRGLMILTGLLVLNISLIAWLVVQALLQTVSGFFTLFIIAAVVVFLPVPFILYRLLSLIRGKYTIDRDGLRIEWGLRTEEIPMHEIEWARPFKDSAFEIALPALAFPGNVLGNITHKDLGLIEFISSETQNLLLLATTRRIYAISPQNNAAFLAALKRFAEMGTISPIDNRSSKANFLVSSLLADRLARSWILLGALFSAVLLVLTAFIIPTRDTIPFGFNPSNGTMDTAPAIRLLLLPILSLLTFTIDLGTGAYFFRKKGYRFTSYLIFASACIPPISFIALIIMFILI